MAETDDIKTLSFEAALKELEGIVGKLESGQAPLAESIAIYERGEALKMHCERLLKEAGFYLAVRAQMPEAKLIEGVPRVVKIASRDVIDSVIGSALPGVVLTHASPPPAPIPSRVGFKYFQLDSIGPYWNGITGSKVISVYVPSEIPDEKLELYAVKP